MHQISPARDTNRDSIRYGLVSLASIFTMGRVVCGFFAIVSTFSAMAQLSTGTEDAGSAAFDRAALAIFCGIVCDCLDGFVARLTGRASDFGREMDSLVDILTFGMAPALLVFFWGMMRAEQSLAGVPRQVLTIAGWVAACVFLIAGVGRLARFNLMTERQGRQNHAVGLAIPGAAAVIAAVVHLARRPPQNWKVAAAWLLLNAVISLLMISRLPYETLQSFPQRLRRVSVLLPLGLLMLAAIYYYSGPVLLTAAAGYAISGPMLALVRRRS
jgi:CDP-diacylglycerol--serine O-phosphatidyltransferase